MLKLEKVAIAEMTLKVTQVVVKGTLFDHLLVSEMTYNVSMGTLNPTILLRSSTYDFLLVFHARVGHGSGRVGSQIFRLEWVRLSRVQCKKISY